MLDTFEIFEDLSQVFGESGAKVLTKAITKIYEDLQNTVTKAEFGRLKEVVGELAVAQKKTEQRLEELAEAQKKTEQRLEELAEAQKKTEQRLEELAEAQKKTEENLNKLIKRVDTIEDQLGGISMAIGYGLEDRLYPYLDAFTRKVYGIIPGSIALRHIISYPDGRYDEVNLFIEGRLNEKSVIVMGECKAQPGKNDIDKFMKKVLRVKKSYETEIFPFIVGYIFSPETEKHILRSYPGLRYYKTYEIEHQKY